MVYVFDAGHSMFTKGKRSPDGKFREYQFNRDIVRRVSSKLDELGIKYFYTYPLEDEYDLSLTTRAMNANKIAKEYGNGNTLFISVHSNAAGMGKWMNAQGYCIYTTKGQNNSDKFATLFWEEAEKVWNGKFGRKMRKDTYSDGDVDYEQNFTVIYKTTCPSILLEQGFYDNKEEMEFLMSDVGRNACAEIIVNAIKRIEGID